MRYYNQPPHLPSAPIVIIISVLFLMLSFLFFSSLKSVWQHDSNPNQFQYSPSSNEMPNVLKIVKMLQSYDFEVFGRVQGVFFRKFTRDKGRELGLKGWCMNTSQGTVVGTMQGPEEKIEVMKDWLRHTGSPMSKIEKCVLSNDRHITKEEFEDFHIKGW